MASQGANRRISTYAGTEGIYLLPHDKQEVERVKNQHALMLSNAGGELIKAPLPPHGKEIMLLDVGCQDGTWLADVSRNYQDRNFALHGIDMTTKFFRAKDNRGRGLDLREHDANEPIPAFWGWNNTFDLVHQRLMIYGVKKEAWAKEVRNLAALVKPGGWIQLGEVEWIYEIDSSKRPLLAKQFALQKWTCEHFGMDIDVVYKLEDYLKEAGLTNVQKFEFKHGIGPEAREDKWKGPSSEMWDETFRSFEAKMPPEGIPGVAKTAEELHDFLDALHKEIKEQGYAPKVWSVVGQKPA